VAEPYLTDLKVIIARLNALHTGMESVSCRHFFSGAAAYVGGQIFVSLSPAGLALKLTEDDCAQLFAQGATSLKYFPKAPVKKGYAVLPTQLVENEKAFMGWIVRSMKFVRGTNG